MENEKIYLKELKEEELTKVFENNQKLKEKIYDVVYENNMFAQEDSANELLNNKINKNNYSIHDHYSSFYLRVKKAYEFIINIDLKNLIDYSIITPEEEKQIKKVINNFKKCNCYTDNYYKWEEIIEKVAAEVIEKIEKYLHEFEDVSEEDCLQYFLDYAAENFEEFYIKEKEKYILYRDVAYTENFQ